MFYDNYLRLCAERGVAPTSLLTELNISKSTIANWKKGSPPSNRTKKQIADYFGLSVEDLMAGKIEKSALKNESGKSRADIEFYELFPKLTEEEKRIYLAQLKGILNSR